MEHADVSFANTTYFSRRDEMTKRTIFFLVSVILFPGLCSAQLPPKCVTSQNTACRHRWEVYTKEVLLKVFPDDSAFIKKLKIVVVSDQEPNAGAHKASDSLHVSYGLTEMIDGEGQYVYVVGHELGHLKMGHGPTAVVSWIGVTENFEL